MQHPLLSGFSNRYQELSKYIIYCKNEIDKMATGKPYQEIDQLLENLTTIYHKALLAAFRLSEKSDDQELNTNFIENYVAYFAAQKKHLELYYDYSLSKKIGQDQNIIQQKYDNYIFYNAELNRTFDNYLKSYSSFKNTINNKLLEEMK